MQSQPTPKVDQLMAMVGKISKDSDKFSDDVRKEMNDLIQARLETKVDAKRFLWHRSFVLLEYSFYLIPVDTKPCDGPIEIVVYT